MTDPLHDELDASTRALFIEQGRKAWAARLAGGAFKDWLLALARVADPNPIEWIMDNVVLNEECWFEAFADGLTPAECWANECAEG